MGTVYFPVSFVLLLWVFWSQPHIAALGIMTMAWGDTFAAIIGMRWGRRQYQIFDRSRSLEVSAAIVASSFISISLTLGGSLVIVVGWVLS